MGFANKITKETKDGKSFYKYSGKNRDCKTKKEHSGKKVVIVKGITKKIQDFIKSVVVKSGDSGWVHLEKSDVFSREYRKDNVSDLKLYCKKICETISAGNDVLIDNDLSDFEVRYIKKSIKGFADFDIRKLKNRDQILKATKNTDKFTQYEFANEIMKSLFINYNVSSVPMIVERAKNIKELIEKIPPSERSQLRARMMKKSI